jgi:hypothetical protein
MNKPSERIQAALLRFKSECPVAQIQQVTAVPTRSERAIIVVDERNLAALLRLSVSGNGDPSDRS